MSPQQERDALLVGGAVAAVAVGYAILHAQTSTPRYSGASVVPPSQSEINAVTQARASEMASASSLSATVSSNVASVLNGLFAGQTTLNLGLAQVQGATTQAKYAANSAADIAHTQANAQTAIASYQAQANEYQSQQQAYAGVTVANETAVAAQAIAQTQEKAIEAAAASQTSIAQAQQAASQAASHASQQNSFWGGLFGAAAAFGL